jgi:hypothetical protein
LSQHLVKSTCKWSTHVTRLRKIDHGCSNFTIGITREFDSQLCLQRLGNLRQQADQTESFETIRMLEQPRVLQLRTRDAQSCQLSLGADRNAGLAAVQVTKQLQNLCPSRVCWNRLSGQQAEW